jgi:hypothetical protein
MKDIRMIMKEFTKEDIQKKASEIQENNKQLSADECWDLALNKVNWVYISANQNLSEDSIREFKDNVDWYCISKYQNLSEEFIREFKDKVFWNQISKFQKLSENLIREFKNCVDWNWISKYQKLSEEFRKEFDLKIPQNNWLRISKEDKLKIIKNSNLYQIIDDQYVIAYKSTKNGHSIYNSNYYYEIGKTYESHCDCNLYEENSFGLAAWTKEYALAYYNLDDVKLFKVKIHIDDLGAFIQNHNGKLRCFKFEVIEEVKNV